VFLNRLGELRDRSFENQRSLAMAMHLPLVHLLSLNIRQLLLLEVCSRMHHVRHVCDTLVIWGRHAAVMLRLARNKGAKQ
jgi:hypothetical protein